MSKEILDNLCSPPYSTIINWVMVAAIAVTMVFAADAANDSRQAYTDLMKDLKDRGCIAVQDSPAVNITGDVLSRELPDQNQTGLEESIP